MLLLDETTNQLNSVLEDRILAYLKQLTKRRELTIVAVSHGKKVSEFANRKYILENGKLIPSE
jgi:ABC-type methionine transport system ATPase subunit